ncbi:MAG TPA: aminotransferase class I/II-fold pyridoxal phosphate-dependent enzyme [Thermodesulfobacteriota bacterium]|nr:aminotransferase class I/II-fold pyridoxal phosphate-dependent enzyme [Thermodesulfobacteriota bacterium]
MIKNASSKRAVKFTESVIREMTRICLKHDGVNLAQGFPDFPAPEEIKEAAVQAIRADLNQYAITWGEPNLRQAIAEKFGWHNGVSIDPEKEITVCCGSTEAMISSLMAIVNSGEEVIVFEPFYENYGPDTILCDARPRFVTLHEPDWHFDEQQLKKTFNNKTKAIVINTPNNPTGKVFSREELQFIADLCVKWGVVAVTDEIYEHILYDGTKHISIASLPGMRDQTITINSISKTYSLTGWRVGWAIAPSSLTSSIRKVHDFLTVGAPHPLQEAAAAALQIDRRYYQTLAREYEKRREFFSQVLEETGFRIYRPHGAYYIMTDIGHFGFSDDVAFALHLVEKFGVATVPGSSFYSRSSLGTTKVRFCFPKRMETLEQAAERLRKFKETRKTTRR